MFEFNQRGMHFCLVDEADSILIDEARTPLIISAIPGEAQMRAVACYQWASEVADQFEEDVHYEYDHEKKTVELTFEGRHLTRKLEKPEEMGPVGLVDIYQYIERAGRPHTRGTQVALIRGYGVAAMPGGTFGQSAGCSLRIAYGALDRDSVADGMGRLTKGLRELL